jgi:hypothetical protein
MRPTPSPWWNCCRQTFTPLDAGTGGCRAGLHVDRLSQNQGAESTLAFLLALTSFKDPPAE